MREERNSYRRRKSLGTAGARAGTEELTLLPQGSRREQILTHPPRLPDCAGIPTTSDHSRHVHRAAFSYGGGCSCASDTIMVRRADSDKGHDPQSKRTPKARLRCEMTDRRAGNSERARLLSGIHAKERQRHLHSNACSRTSGPDSPEASTNQREEEFHLGA